MATKKHKEGWPRTCTCGVVLHTPKSVKFHSCPRKPRQQATSETEA